MGKNTVTALAGVLVVVSSVLMQFSCSLTTCAPRSLVDYVPPETLTESHLVMLEANIDSYAQVYHRLPNALSDLPRVVQEGDHLVKDGWGNKIAYSHTSDGQVTLSSPGPDRTPGEKGAIIRRFKVEAGATSASQPDSAKDQGKTEVGLQLCE